MGRAKDETAPEAHDELKAEEIDFILDGQQRITSIYKLFPEILAPTEHELDSRFKGLRFFLDLEKLGLPRGWSPDWAGGKRRKMKRAISES